MFLFRFRGTRCYNTLRPTSRLGTPGARATISCCNRCGCVFLGSRQCLPIPFVLLIIRWLTLTALMVKDVAASRRHVHCLRRGVIDGHYCESPGVASDARAIVETMRLRYPFVVRPVPFAVGSPHPGSPHPPRRRSSCVLPRFLARAGWSSDDEVGDASLGGEEDHGDFVLRVYPGDDSNRCL